MRRNFKILISFFIFTLLIFRISLSDKANLIIFSYDRPMQLYALLESVEKYITNLDDISIIYRTSNTEFLEAYDKVIKRFNSCKYYLQSNQPLKDFKPILLNCINNSKNEYVVFGVDDIIIKDYIDISKCVDALKNTNAYGFYLRLGFNITENYMGGFLTPVPKHSLVENGIYSFCFKDSKKGSWGLNCSLDMTIFNKKVILPEIERINFTSPNIFEYNWFKMQLNLEKMGLFFSESKIINIPLNLVQKDIINSRNMNLFTTKDLLDKFNQGFKIDIEQFYKIKNKSCHMEVVPKFIRRQDSTIFFNP